ncbi:hypothetical protein HY374_02440 [Candidatus Berkelbacteria bacterium]|nr:hypothetical protein [Candidatus Berkelbacteria bacterium]
MAVIVPAILAESPAALTVQAERVVSLAPLISFDVADGEFVSARTPLPTDYPKLPPGKSVFWHLMVHEPVRYLEDCLAVPSQIIAVHAEARGVGEALDVLAERDILTGLVINPETPVSLIEPALDRVDLVQVMTVQPGAQGSRFFPEQLGKLSQLRALRENLVLAVDGGVSRATVEVVSRYRPEYLVVGSALLEANEPAEEYRILSRLAAIASR